VRHLKFNPGRQRWPRTSGAVARLGQMAGALSINVRAGRSLKSPGCMANLYCQAEVPPGARGRRDAENRFQQEA
jgi:hypothetical protein